MSLVTLLRPRVIALFTAAALTLSACGGNYWFKNEQGTFYNANVDCAPPGNEDGFVMELPSCYCEGGIKFELVVEQTRNGKERYIAFKRGYLDEDRGVGDGYQSTIITHDGHTISEMRVMYGGVESKVTDPEILGRETEVLAENFELLGEFQAIMQYCMSQKS